MSKDKPKIVEAIGVAKGTTPIGKNIQRAMEQAIHDALAEGIPTSDPRIKERMMAAREKVKASYKGQ